MFRFYWNSANTQFSKCKKVPTKAYLLKKTSLLIFCVPVSFKSVHGHIKCLHVSHNCIAFPGFCFLKAQLSRAYKLMLIYLRNWLLGWGCWWSWRWRKRKYREEVFVKIEPKMFSPDSNKPEPHYLSQTLIMPKISLG